MVPSTTKNWCSCLKELSGGGLAFAAAEVCWIVARGQKGEWGLTESRRPKVRRAPGESCAPPGHERAELELKSRQINRKHTHVGRTYERTREYVQQTLCVCGVKATGPLYKRILCSILQHTHSVHTHTHQRNMSAPCIPGRAERGCMFKAV